MSSTEFPLCEVRFETPIRGNASGPSSRVVGKRWLVRCWEQKLVWINRIRLAAAATQPPLAHVTGLIESFDLARVDYCMK